MLNYSEIEDKKTKKISSADVAQQIVGLAFGMQDKFSLKEVGNQFEQGFITGALAGALVGTKLDILSGTMNRASGAAAGATTASGTTLDFPHLLLANEVMTLGGDAILVATGQKKGDMIWKDCKHPTNPTLSET